MGPRHAWTGLKERMGIVNIDSANADEAMVTIEKWHLKNPDMTQLVRINLASPQILQTATVDQAMTAEFLVKPNFASQVPETFDPLVLSIAEMWHLSSAQVVGLTAFLKDPRRQYNQFLSLMKSSLADGTGARDFNTRLLEAGLDYITNGNAHIFFPQFNPHTKMLDLDDAQALSRFAGTIIEKLAKRKEKGEFDRMKQKNFFRKEANNDVPLKAVMEESSLLARLIDILGNIKGRIDPGALLATSEYRFAFSYYLENTITLSDITTLDALLDNDESIEYHKILAFIFPQSFKAPALKSPEKKEKILPDLQVPPGEKKQEASGEWTPATIDFNSLPLQSQELSDQLVTPVIEPILDVAKILIPRDNLASPASPTRRKNLKLERQALLWHNRNYYLSLDGITEGNTKIHKILFDLASNKFLSLGEDGYELNFNDDREIVIESADGRITNLDGLAQRLRVYTGTTGSGSEILMIDLQRDKKIIMIEKETTPLGVEARYGVAVNNVIALEFSRYRNTFSLENAKILFSQRGDYTVKDQMPAREANLIMQLLKIFFNRSGLADDTVAGKFQESLEIEYTNVQKTKEIATIFERVLFGFDSQASRLILLSGQEAYYFPEEISQGEPTALLKATDDGTFIFISGNKVGVFSQQQLEHPQAPLDETVGGVIFGLDRALEVQNSDMGGVDFDINMVKVTGMTKSIDDDQAMGAEKNKGLIHSENLGGMDLNTANTDITIEGKAPLSWTNPDNIVIPKFVSENFHGFRADFVSMRGLSINQLLPLFGL